MSEKLITSNHSLNPLSISFFLFLSCLRKNLSLFFQRRTDSLSESAEMGINSENGMTDQGDAVLDKNLYSRQM